MTGGRVGLTENVDQAGTVVIGTLDSCKTFLSETDIQTAATLAQDGFMLKRMAPHEPAITVVTSVSESGVLYGVFHFLRLLQTEIPIGNFNIIEEPAADLRIWNHS